MSCGQLMTAANLCRVAVYTPVDGKSDRTVESDTNINCTRFLLKRKKYICEHIHTSCVLYSFCISLFLFNNNIQYKCI